jgi:hypothetical protein
MKIITALIISLLFITIIRADEIKTGLFYHDISPLWGNTRIEQGIDLNLEYIHTLGFISPHAGFYLNSKNQSHRLYCGFNLATQSTGLFASMGLGLCCQLNAIRKLGSSVLFRIALELGFSWKRSKLSIMLDHISNANLASHNEGLDVLGLRYTYILKSKKKGGE